MIASSDSSAATFRRMADTIESRPKHKLRVPRARRGTLRILIGTRKGAFAIEGDATRTTWDVTEPWHLGSTCFHVVADPRQRRTILAAVRTPEGKPTVMVSKDAGKTWTAALQPPAFSEEASDGSELEKWSDADREWDRTVEQVFWLSPGHAYEPQTWFAGTSPQGLFRSDDCGLTWSPVDGLHRSPDFDAWTSIGSDQTPDGAKLHSILIDPREADHMFVALSSGGVLETTDAGVSWTKLPSESDAGSDPHSLVMATTNPDLLWLQSHYGVYRMETVENRTWERVGPTADGDYHDAGFPITVDPSDPDVAWVIPMDDSDAWTRMPAGGRPALFRTEDGGTTWERQDKGFPKTQSWWTVKRQCLATDGFDPLGLYFGTSNGEVWASTNEGEHWTLIARGLPHVYSVEVG